MGRFNSFTSRLTNLFSVVFFLVAPCQTKSAPDANPLKLLISVEQQSITSPFPARVTLHLHNSGREPLWLYRRARSQTQEGSSLKVQLEPTGILQGQEISTPGQGTALESVGLPRPKLVRLDAGEDYEEKPAIRLEPAVAGPGGESKPIWGRYRLSVVYRAGYSNGEEMARILGVVTWRGEVTSNTIEVELLPAGAAAQGSVAGTVIGSDGVPLRDVLVSLSDQEERLLDQSLTGAEGRFSFPHLPLALYWLTARIANSTTDTVVFRHIELTPDQPAGAMELVMLPQEVYEAKGMLHKPVLFRITDSAGAPLDKVMLEVTWSNGPVLDNVRVEVLDDGTAALELIPGRNFVTLKRRGCPKEEQRVDVAAGDGIDGFKLALECGRK